VIAVLLGYGLSTVILPTGAPAHGRFAYVLFATAFAVLFLAGLLGHELAHALVAQRHGVGVRRITLWLLGGVSELEGDSPTPKAELRIAAAGPLASLVFGGLAAIGATAAAAAGASSLIRVGLTWLAWVNVVLAIFNLLPGAPLDGGRIVRAVVWRVRGDRDRAQIAADRAGAALGVLLAAFGLVQVLIQASISGLWLVLLGWFLVTAANAETESVRLHRALDGRSVRDIMAVEPVYGLDSQSIDAFIASTAARHPHATYPVVDPEGRLVGLVRLSDLARIPTTGRSELPLRAAVTPAAAVPAVGPGEPASAAARNLSPANPLLAVTDNDRLVGVVSAGDVENAVALSMLGHASDGHRPDRPPG
jgi:Zn-dependent protease/CBS domain-containing protein